ncbi:MAG: hypothetical protein ABEH56_07720 [Salinirussus sp.]
MSLFRTVGKKFEETKRTFVSEGEPAYVCVSCDQPVTEDYDHCPHCGEGTVEPAE